jgi:2-C-methyl-D-erythritol 4-phosphate cytidylyltransferase
MLVRRSLIMDKSKVFALIVAAGKGKRMKMAKNKQYIEIGGIPVIAKTLRQFDNHFKIDEIIVVVCADEIEYFMQSIIDEYNFNKPIKVVSGGKERQESVYNGLKNIYGSGIVLIHDGARPFLGKDLIDRSIENALTYKAAVAAVPVKDTIKISDNDGFINQTLRREVLWSIQTPQSFDVEIITKAHERALKENFLGTDDAVLVERIGYKTKIFMGSYYNIKITTSEDIVFAEAIATMS